MMSSVIVGMATLASAQTQPPVDSESRPTAPIVRQAHFEILRNGSKIGDYSLRETSNGNTETIDYLTDIKVDVLMITAYQSHHEGREIWSNGAFVSYKGSTTVNGDKTTVGLSATGASETLTINGKSTKLPKGVIPATLWRPRFIGATSMIDPDNGKIVGVSVSDLGKEQINVANAPTVAEHYRIGGFGWDVWMAQGSLVRFQLKGSDGSNIESEITSASDP